MISGGELRKGVIIDLDGKPYQVIDYQHVKMKRTALARVKLRDVTAGHTVERTFQSDDKLVRVNLESRPMQYLYNDGGLYYFMDERTYEQVPLTSEQLGDALNYLKENFSVALTTYGDDIIGVELPVSVELEITHTDPGFKGDTATAGTKPATLETGLTVQVPLFVNQGDTIKVDTRTGVYLERAG
ncbi:MAG: elongation factor P [Chloroflexota bacterium]